MPNVLGVYDNNSTETFRPISNLLQRVVPGDEYLLFEQINPTIVCMIDTDTLPGNLYQFLLLLCVFMWYQILIYLIVKS